jgi:hypothetical protein
MSGFLAMGRPRNQMLGHQANSELEDQEGPYWICSIICV